jgi:methionyl-tRNA formyltransferase
VKFIYLSRHNNRSGFFILDHLLRNTLHVPEAVLLPTGAGREIHQKLEERSGSESSCYELPTLERSQCIAIEGLCREFNIPVIEIADINAPEGLLRVQSASPDLLVLGGGWPQLLSKEVCKCAPLGVINTHPSLLPGFRGTDVHRWQIYEGVNVSGTTIHYIDGNFDTGNVLAQCAIAVWLGDTPQQLAIRTGLSAGPLMEGVLQKISETAPNLLAGQQQNQMVGKESYFSRWPWEDRQFLAIRWKEPNYKILQLILASTQENIRYNGPHFRVMGKDVIVRRASIVDRELDLSVEPGEVVMLDPAGLVVACGQGMLRLEILQEMTSFWPEGFNTVAPIFGYEFCLEHNIQIGITLQESVY